VTGAAHCAQTGQGAHTLLAGSFAISLAGSLTGALFVAQAASRQVKNAATTMDENADLLLGMVWLQCSIV
jgi:hypothetical protein